MEQSILLNKGFDERRGSVLIWIRNLCLRAPFLSRLPSTTPLWFKAVFGFSSASQVITFQHVAPFRGELTSAVISSFPTRGDPEERGKNQRGVDILSLHAHLHARVSAWMCCAPSGCPLPTTASSAFISDQLQRLQFGCVPGVCSVDIPTCPCKHIYCVTLHTSCRETRSHDQHLVRYTHRHSGWLCLL